jgi:hypothetical protein
MNESQAQQWMKEFAGETVSARMPEAEFLWAGRRLEAEFEQRRKLGAPLFWMEVALQTAGAAVLAVAVAGLLGI